MRDGGRNIHRVPFSLVRSDTCVCQAPFRHQPVLLPTGDSGKLLQASRAIMVKCLLLDTGGPE